MAVFACSQCKGKMGVVDSRATGAIDGSISIRRRRECVKCEIRITTYESTLDANETIRLRNLVKTKLRDAGTEVQRVLKRLEAKE